MDEDHAILTGDGVGAHARGHEGRQADQPQRMAVVDRDADVDTFQMHVGHVSGGCLLLSVYTQNASCSRIRRCT